MRICRLVVGAVALAGVLGAGLPARASFIYSVSPLTTSTNFGSGSNQTVAGYNNGANSPILSGTQIINLAQIMQTSTASPAATDSATIPISMTATIANQNGGGTSAFLMSGTFHVTRSDSQGASSSFSLNSIAPPTLTLGAFTYTLSSPLYAPPTIGAGGSGNGSLSFTITETVPEPCSLALLGVGAMGLVARRRARA